uniref:protein NDRG2 isoform X3 n=1 Tax=Ciona intestinalis TaxID=7719 RepID=UPI0002B8E079|nr:protein NDRG2 isoform X3 [Ciona intestinalis]|eukprot:XP_026692341.1 protein NDRG2 isoform X3 [Ciona intestinalis]
MSFNYEQMEGVENPVQNITEVNGNMNIENDVAPTKVDQDNVVECTYTAAGNHYSTKLHVVVQGNRSLGHSIVTFHDVGLNSVSNFGALMNSEAMEPVAHKYCVYHINAPGQEEHARTLPSGHPYPTMENLSDMVPKIFQEFGIKSAICLGSGAGANVFLRFAFKNPSMVEGLIAVNPTISTVGNLSWIGEKITNWTTPFSDQIMNYYFTKSEVELQNHELLDTHRIHFKKFMNEENVINFMKSYERRSDINITRSPDPQQVDKTTLKCQTLILVGDLSPFVDEAVEVNSRLNVKKTTFLKMADAGGMILEEQIFNVAEAITYFLQGLGHRVPFKMRGSVPGVMMTRLARSRTISNSSTGSADGDHKRIRTLSGGSANNDITEARHRPQKDKTHLISGAVC